MYLLFEIHSRTIHFDEVYRGPKKSAYQQVPSRGLGYSPTAPCGCRSSMTIRDSAHHVKLRHCTIVTVAICLRHAILYFCAWALFYRWMSFQYETKGNDAKANGSQIPKVTKTTRWHGVSVASYVRTLFCADQTLSFEQTQFAANPSDFVCTLS